MQDKVELIGWIDKKNNFYDNIDIFVLPSREEPFGLVLLEAMMYSKPIISSNASGPSEIFNNQDSALMFDAGNTEDLAEKMEEMLNNFEMAKKMAKVFLSGTMDVCIMEIIKTIKWINIH